MHQDFSSIEFIKILKNDNWFQKQIVKPYIKKNFLIQESNISTVHEKDSTKKLSIENWLARVDSVERNRLPREYFPDKGFEFMK